MSFSFLTLYADLTNLCIGQNAKILVFVIQLPLLPATCLQAGLTRPLIDLGGHLTGKYGTIGLHGIPRISVLTPKLTSAGPRSIEGTNTGHENGAAMASVGIRVERPVRLSVLAAVVSILCAARDVRISALHR